MATHNITGKNGEIMAADYLERNGFTLLHRNWRHSHYEIDIIAERKGILHFVEVKTRRSLKFGYPEESVSSKKMENLVRGAGIFLEQHTNWKRIQFDILSIIISKDDSVEFSLIEDLSP